MAGAALWSAGDTPPALDQHRQGPSVLQGHPKGIPTSNQQPATSKTMLRRIRNNAPILLTGDMGNLVAVELQYQQY